MKALKISAKDCVGCEICGITCSVTHGNEPRASAMRIRIKRRLPDLPIPAFQPMVCRNCGQPKCIEACPKEALILDRDVQQVLLTESKCDGCGRCVDVCPFHAIWVDPLRKVAIKCDLCMGGEPVCVQYCRFGAIRLPSEAKG